MQVARFMTRHPVTITPETPLEDAIALMEQRGFRHLPVERGGELVGMISDRDVQLGTGGRSVAGLARPIDGEMPRRVADVVRSPVPCVESDERGPVAAKRMVEHRLGALPVLEDGLLIGIVTETNLVGAFRDLCRDPAHADVLDATVEEVMHSPAITFEANDELDAALARLTDWRVRHVPVFDEDDLVGIVSDRDIRFALGRALLPGNDDQGPQPRTVRDIMSREVVSADPRDMLSSTVSSMLPARLTALPVMLDGMLLGVVTRTDILEHYANVA